MNAALRRETNNLSPLVVFNVNIPFLGFPPGTFFFFYYITVMQRAIKIKMFLNSQNLKKKKKKISIY